MHKSIGKNQPFIKGEICTYKCNSFSTNEIHIRIRYKPL